MKTNLIFIILIIFLFACRKYDVIKSELKSFVYEFSFSTESRPVSIACVEKDGEIYVANSESVQKFDKNGIFEETIVNLASFEYGKFERYFFVDIVVDNNKNLYVLARPLIPWIDESWMTLEGFSILMFNNINSFIKEFDFSENKDLCNASSISYYNNHLYIPSRKSIKQINIENEDTVSIPLPVIEDDKIGFFGFDYLISDMEINHEGVSYFTGPAFINKDSIGCYITSYNLNTKKIKTNFGNGWTWECCAMPNNPGIYIDNDGFLYLASFYNMSFEIFNERLNFLAEYDIKTSESEITRPIDIISLKGKVYVVDSFNDKIYVYKQE